VFKRLLSILEEPREIGCLGLIIVIILMALCQKCGSDTDLSNIKREASGIKYETPSKKHETFFKIQNRVAFLVESPTK
jgi:hypothetical protein